MTTLSDDQRHDEQLLPPVPGVDPSVLHVPAGSVPPSVRLDLYRMQVRMRGFEKRAYDLFMQGLVKGTSHLSLGMEGVAAGFGVAMRAGDYTYATYRGHAHTLARGCSMTGAMGELLGRSNGLLKGKGGSMHLTDVDHGMMGSYAIIGAHLPIALGAAWSSQYRGTEQVAVCFFGDGTTNIGAFHEALNLAAVWKAPVVYVCENNLYMEYTPIGEVTAVPHPAADRAAAYGLDRIIIDGNDADVVYLTALEVYARARRGEGPALVEALTYRHGGHSRADPGKYRPQDEVDAWLARDPVTTYRARLLADGVDEADLTRIGPDADRGRVAGRGRRGDRGGEGVTAAGARRADGRRVGRRRCVVAELTYREAVARAIAQEMRRDPAVALIGEDVGAAGGVFKATPGLLEEFGDRRVIDTPISEQAILGAAMGAAMTGMRPVAEIMFSDFFAVCWDIVVNEIAKSRYMTGGQVSFPLVIRTGNGGGLRFGAQHSQSIENWAMAVPGIKVVAPSSPSDVVGLFAAAVRDDDPVLFLEHKALYPTKGEVPDGEIVDELGVAKVLRRGGDVTIVALAAMVPKAMKAAVQLAAVGIEATVVDVRCLVPLDTRTILAEVAATGRLFTVEENPRLCGWGAEITSIVTEEAFWDLDGPIVRITTPHIPLPSADALEDLAIPSADRIAETIQKAMQ